MAAKILIVDDEETNIRIVQSRLEKNGYEVISALDGDTGLDKMEEAKPDLILLDIQMPIMSGYDFMMEKEKRADDVKKIPVIIMTSHQEMQSIFQRKGVKGYLVKPINFDEMFQKIEESLGNG